MQTEFKPGNRVSVVCGHHDERILKTGSVYEVAVVVSTGIDHTQLSVSGLILRPLSGVAYYPYIWDFNRFVLAK